MRCTGLLFQSDGYLPVTHGIAEVAEFRTLVEARAWARERLSSPILGTDYSMSHERNIADYVDIKASGRTVETVERPMIYVKSIGQRGY